MSCWGAVSVSACRTDAPQATHRQRSQVQPPQPLPAGKPIEKEERQPDPGKADFKDADQGRLVAVTLPGPGGRAGQDAEAADPAGDAERGQGLNKIAKFDHALSRVGN